jgi:O-antigen biosynthesis protein WbqP
MKVFVAGATGFAGALTEIHGLPHGLADWAQIIGLDELPIPVKAAFDEYYLRNHSMLLDVKIILLTFLKVAKREGVTH